MLYKITIIICVLFCIIGISCNEAEKDNTIITVVPNEDVPVTEFIFEEQELYQEHALSFGGYSYIFLENALYKIDAMNGSTKLLDCVDAVGTIANDLLYFAILDDKNILHIINVDENGYTYQLGIIEEVADNVDFLDISYDYLFIQYTNGSVSVYSLQTNGLLGAQVPDMLFCYSDKNKQILSGEQSLYGVHMFPGGFTLNQYQCELIATKVPNTNSNKKQLFCKKHGEESYLFEFYGDVLLKDDSIIYVEDYDFTKLMRYNMETAVTDILITFVDGSFLPIVIEDNYLYGNWYSKENNEFYISKFDLETGAFTTIQKVKKNEEFIILNHTIYQIGDNDTLIFNEI